MKTILNSVILCIPFPILLKHYRLLLLCQHADSVAQFLTIFILFIKCEIIVYEVILL